MARRPLTRKRLLGLDRSGPPPLATRRGQPLNPWTVPNVVGFTRLALIPVFLALAFSTEDGRSPAAFLLFAFIGASDYLDGILARLTGQYSRLGALLDPLTDRLLVLSGAAVAWHFELLPRWALAVLAVREAFMLVAGELALRRAVELAINMTGRWAVWPTMFSFFLAMVTETWVSEALLFLGLAMTLWATAIYVRDGVRATRPSTSA